MSLAPPITRQAFVHLPRESVGAELWEPLVEATQQDYAERGVYIGHHATKGYIRSELVEGFPAQIDDDTGEVLEAHFPSLMFPFGFLRSLSPRFKAETVVHTHPIPPSLDHLHTIPVSDSDIHSFIRSPYSNFVMLDKGGAHLLKRTKSGNRINNFSPPQNLVTDTIRESLQLNENLQFALGQIASHLSNYGVGYYFRTGLSTEDEAIEFQSLKPSST